MFFALIGRLFLLAGFGGLTLWLANDVRRNLRTGYVPAHTILRWGQTFTRAERPYLYWSNVVSKMIGVFAAACLTAWVFYLFATN